MQDNSISFANEKNEEIRNLDIGKFSKEQINQSSCSFDSRDKPTEPEIISGYTMIPSSCKKLSSLGFL